MRFGMGVRSKQPAKGPQGLTMKRKNRATNWLSN